MALLRHFGTTPEVSRGAIFEQEQIARAQLARLPRAYWSVVGLGAVFTLARFSEAFLVLRAQQSGMALAWVPLVMVAMNAVYAASAYPFGRLADTVSHRGLLAAGKPHLQEYADAWARCFFNVMNRCVAAAR